MDLHMHSTFSDGELHPSQLIQEARQQGVSIISITDHDAIDGYFEGLKYADRFGVHLIPGIELNTDGVDGELHILGYHFNPAHPKLGDHIKWRKEDRLAWGKKMVNRLQDMGYKVSWENCLQRATGGIVVRTHIADELVSAGYFENVKVAYNKLLKKGSPAFVQREPFSAKDAIHLIHSIDGEAYLAHPAIYSFEFSVERLVSYGLDGIEVYHSKHREEDQIYWEQTANHFHLKQSGGSDYHGPHSRNPYSIGSVKIPDEICNNWYSLKR